MLKKQSFLRKSNTGCEDIHHSCTVRFLDDAEPITVTFQKSSKGQEIIDHVCSKLNLLERDCFGLRYVDTEKQRHWLYASRNAYTQLKKVNPMVLCFRVKFYPSEPLKLKEEITRYYLYQQLVRDAHHGRLLCTVAEANQLAAYIVQDEIGDYEDDLPNDYISKIKMLPKPCQKHDAEICELHKKLSGMNPSEVELEFLSMAAKLETYGVDPYPVKDLVGVQKYIGITHNGIVTFQGNKRTNQFVWPDVSKLDFEGKHFIIHANDNEDKNAPITGKRKKHAYHFKCTSAKACKHLWKSAVEQQYFFTLQSSSAAPKISSGRGFLRRGSSFKFSGHCESEAFAESEGISRDEPKFTRSASNPSLQLRHNSSIASNTLPRGIKPSDLYDTSISSGGQSDFLNSSLLSKDTTVGDSATLHPFSSTPNPADDKDKVQAEISANLGAGIPPQDERARDLRLGETTQDLDAQIRELQIELDRCKKTNSTPLLKKPNGLDSLSKESDVSCIGNHAVPAADKATPESKKMSSHLLRNIAIFLLVTTLVVFLFLYLVYETKSDLPLVSSMREFPEVQQFEKDYYRPARKSIFG